MRHKEKRYPFSNEIFKKVKRIRNETNETISDKTHDAEIRKKLGLETQLNADYIRKTTSTGLVTWSMLNTICKVLNVAIWYLSPPTSSLDAERLEAGEISIKDLLLEQKAEDLRIKLTPVEYDEEKGFYRGKAPLVPPFENSIVDLNTAYKQIDDFESDIQQFVYSQRKKYKDSPESLDHEQMYSPESNLLMLKWILHELIIGARFNNGNRMDPAPDNIIRFFEHIYEIDAVYGDTIMEEAAYCVAALIHERCDFYNLLIESPEGGYKWLQSKK